jgi:hypothetical protein
MSGDSKSFARTCLYAGTDWTVYCHAYDDQVPILDIDGGSSSLAISTRGRQADQAAVEFARAFLSEVQRFAAEVERLHAAQLDDGDGKAAGSDAA